MSTTVSPSDQIRSLKRRCPFFTAHDIAMTTGFRLSVVENALRELPQDTSDRMPVYAMKEIAD
jgi:hypothetical protein